MKKIAILNGPNLNRLGKREPLIYGTGTLADLEKLVRAEAKALGVSVTFFQSNHEGALIDKIHELADAGVEGFIVNFAAYSHTSIALLDALKSVGATRDRGAHLGHQATRALPPTFDDRRSVHHHDQRPGVSRLPARAPATGESVTMGPSSSSPLAPRWIVCHTRPRCEKKFAALLVAEKLEHYLPLRQSVRRYAKQTKRFTKPLFPGYVFAHVPAEKKPRIFQQDLLARVIAVEDEATFLRQLGDVRAIVASGLVLSVLPLLTKGRRVRIIGGPLHGLEGYVDNSSNPQGIVLAVDVLQQGLLVKMPIENLLALP